MESEDDDGFANNSQLDRRDGILLEILSQVETKIPSLDFSDDDGEEPDDATVWSPPENLPYFYKQFSDKPSVKDTESSETVDSSPPSASTVCCDEITNNCINDYSKVKDMYKHDLASSRLIDASIAATNIKSTGEQCVYEKTHLSRDTTDEIILNADASDVSIPLSTHANISSQPEDDSPPSRLGPVTTDSHYSNIGRTSETEMEVKLDVKQENPNSDSDKKAEKIKNIKSGQVQFNFNQVQKMLSSLPTKLGLPDFPTSTSPKQPLLPSVCDRELMSQLSNLSKDQLNVCSGVLRRNKDVNRGTNMHQKMKTHKGSTFIVKPIHSWSQLINEDSSNEERQTIFLDLRPEAELAINENDNGYSASIQRILGLNKSGSVSSASESDDEMDEWQEMREKVKQSSKKQLAAKGVNVRKPIRNYNMTQNAESLADEPKIRNEEGSPKHSLGNMKHENVGSAGSLDTTYKKDHISFSDVFSEEFTTSSFHNKPDICCGKGQSDPSTAITLVEECSNKSISQGGYDKTSFASRISHHKKKLHPRIVGKESLDFTGVRDGRPLKIASVFPVNSVVEDDEEVIRKERHDEAPTCDRGNVGSNVSHTSENYEHEDSRVNLQSLHVNTDNSPSLGSEEIPAVDKEEKQPYEPIVTNTATHVTHGSNFTVMERLKRPRVSSEREFDEEKEFGTGRKKGSKKHEVSNNAMELKPDLLSLLIPTKVRYKTEIGEMESVRQQVAKKMKLKKIKEGVMANLENGRPTLTSSGKYQSAYNTPIIYDQDTSYEPQPQGLTTKKGDVLNLLLVITLSGSGEIHNQYTKGRGYNSHNDINFYFVLISWLLQLNEDTSSKNCSQVPFRVVAMHQACQNDRLQLFVGVEPNETVFHAAGSRKMKARSFHKTISKYLSTHSLRNMFQNVESIYHDESVRIVDNAFCSRMLSTFIAVGWDFNSVGRVFRGKSGFYWETHENSASWATLRDVHYLEKNTENTVVLVRAPLCHNPSCILDLLTRISCEGCDVAGLRLVVIDDLNSDHLACNDGGKNGATCNSYPYVAIAVRGPFAVSKVKIMIGSRIPSLDDHQQALSLRSLYCSTGVEDTLFYCPSYSSQAAAQLARIFGGRPCEEDIVRSMERSGPTPRSPDGISVQKPPSFLVASTRVSVYLVISKLVPPAFLGDIINLCSLKCFVLLAIRRVRINKRQGANLGFSQSQLNAFCSSSGSTRDLSPNESTSGSPGRRRSSFTLVNPSKSCPTTVLQLQRENGLYHSFMLIKNLFDSLKEWMEIHVSSLSDLHRETSARMYFNVIRCNETTTKSLWSDVCYRPDDSLLRLARNHRFCTNDEVEQVCVLSSVQSEAKQKLGELLKKLANSDEIVGAWELLGIKSFPNLNVRQAREVTPYEIDDRSWLHSIKLLTSSTVFTCVLRGVNMINRLRDFMHDVLAKTCTEGIRDLRGWWFSQTPEVAFRQLSVLFEEWELISDEARRANANYIPPFRQRSLVPNYKSVAEKNRHCKFYTPDISSNNRKPLQVFREVPIIDSLLAGPRPLPTIALIKPWCVASPRKIAKIFKSFLQENFEIVALSLRLLTRSEAEVLLSNADTDASGNIQYLTSGPSLVLCLQRENAVKKLLDIIGPKDPIIARSLDPFLLRGCYGVDCVHNAVHGSQSYSSAVLELKKLFPSGVSCGPTIDLEAEQISCRVHDSRITKKPERKSVKSEACVASDLMHSMMQVNCVILSHRIVYGRNSEKRIALVDVLDCLLSSSFIPVGMKMAFLSHDQANQVLFITGTTSPDAKHRMMKELTDKPCIVLALQRENAVTCFDFVIESFDEKRASIADYRKHIVKADTEEEAEKLLLYFFDELMPRSTQHIF